MSLFPPQIETTAEKGSSRLVPDGDERRAEPALALEKPLQTGPVGVRPGGIRKGIVAHEARFRFLHGHEVGPQPGPPAPVVEENAHIRRPGLGVVAPAIFHQLYRKAPLPEAQGRSKEAGAQIPVDQGELPREIADEGLLVRVPAQAPSGAYWISKAVFV